MRDPRQDPKPGDIVELISGSMAFVDELPTPLAVRFRRMKPSGFSIEQTVPLNHWRGLTVGAAIVNVQ